MGLSNAYLVRVDGAVPPRMSALRGALLLLRGAPPPKPVPDEVVRGEGRVRGQEVRARLERRLEAAGVGESERR